MNKIGSISGRRAFQEGAAIAYFGWLREPDFQKTALFGIHGSGFSERLLKSERRGGFYGRIAREQESGGDHYV